MVQFLRTEIAPYPDNVTQLTLLCVGWAAIGDMSGRSQAKFDIEAKNRRLIFDHLFCSGASVR
jgi:hypothetical protein